jgi:hypothetical protein
LWRPHGRAWGQPHLALQAQTALARPVRPNDLDPTSGRPSRDASPLAHTPRRVADCTALTSHCTTRHQYSQRGLILRRKHPAAPPQTEGVACIAATTEAEPPRPSFDNAGCGGGAMVRGNDETPRGRDVDGGGGGGGRSVGQQTMGWFMRPLWTKTFSLAYSSSPATAAAVGSDG